MTAFRVWAPVAGDVELVTAEESVAMRAEDGGWWATDIPDAAAGVDYGFRLDGGQQVLPDPRSPHQPGGVHGRSRTVDLTAFAWTDGGWRGRPLAGTVLYELHVGTFTPAGTFDAAIDKLPHLLDLGIDAVEVLPVAAAAGSRGWGYDGVDLYAATENYGGPAAFARFVDAAHRAGLAVVLDVVYNHFGPSGNYLPHFGPYFGDAASPWGQSMNLDGPGSDEVRGFLIDNALMWLRDYHVDGLRLDAVHALHDSRAIHFLEQLALDVDALAAHLGRPLWLIAESDLNDPRLIRAREAGGYGLTAQWDDDLHHALHAAVTGERQGYYVDFGPLAVLAKAMTQAFVHDGSYSTFRGRGHGRAAGDLPGDRFVVFAQDHDQIGNRAQGDRLSATLSPAQCKIVAALILCSPYTPMLFMGEEWGASTPWQFFADPDSPQLRDATRDGRRKEFADHGWAPGGVPDPCAEETFTRSTLDWSELDDEQHHDLFAWYQSLLTLRRNEANLRDGRRDRTRASFDEEVRWFALHRGDLVVVANLGDARVQVPLDGTPVEVLAASEAGFSYGDGEVALEGASVLVLRLLPRATS